MSREGDDSRRIHEWLDGSIAHEDFERLQQALLEDGNLRQEYYALLTTDQMLVQTFGRGDGADPAVREPTRWHRWRAFLLLGLVILLSAALYPLWRFQSQPVRLAGSADGRFLVDGAMPSSDLWRKGQVLEVKDGLVFARLGSGTRACLEAPARAVLVDHDDIELVSGRIYLEVPPGTGFGIGAAGAQMRTEGADFGVAAAPSAGEIRVDSGGVDLQLPASGVATVGAGLSRAWNATGVSSPAVPGSPGFLREGPEERVVFADDFSEPGGTALEAKPPDIGLPWTVRDEHSTTRLGGGRLDTSGGFRHLSAGFLPPPASGPHVLVLTLRTVEPRVVEDKKQRLSGYERLTLLADDGRPIASLVAVAREDHRWRLRSESSKEESALTAVSAIAPHDLTLRHDVAAGRISFHAGATPQSPLLAEVRVPEGIAPAGFELWNDYGGDLALERVTARVVVHRDRR